MRQLRFASSVAAALAVLGTAASAASVDVGPVSLLIGSTSSVNSKWDPQPLSGLWEPRGITVDSAGEVYVADFTNSRLVRLDATTNAMTEIKTGEMPIGVLIDPTDDNIIYVTWHMPPEGSSGRVEKYSISTDTGVELAPNGEDAMMVDYYAATESLYWGSRADARVRHRKVDVSNGIQTIATDVGTIHRPNVQPSNGRIWISSRPNNYVMDNDGSNQQIIGGSSGLAAYGSSLSRDERYFFVANWNNNQIFRIDTSNPTATPDTILAGASPTQTYSASYAASTDLQANVMLGVQFSQSGDTMYLAGAHAAFKIAYNDNQATTTTTAAPTPACDCDAEKLEVVYSSDAIPDATADAITNISLDTDTWEVVFEVRNVRAITNGHVIAAPVDTFATAAVAFTPWVSSFDANDLWTPQQCGLGGIDTPATNLNINAVWDNAACRTKYEMRYSLVDPAKQDTRHCTLTDDNAGEIKVNCSVILSSVRAYDSTDPEAFLAQEAAFAGEISLGTQLNNEVENLLHATLAKCSVKNGPLYVVDCRVPGAWNFQPTFSLVQEPANWINAASCAATQTATATFIRCDIENNAPIANVDTARANLTATPDETTTNPMTFDIEFIVPRRITTSTSASLASFIQGISMADGKYYYGTADKATLHIDVFDSSRLTMTALELFNSATPSKEVQDLFPGTSDARFQTAVNANPTRFIVDFYPAAIRENSRFYRFGPHGINISFTFAAARRAEEGTGYAVVEGLNVEGSEDVEGSGAGATFAVGSSSNAAMVAGIAIASVVAIVGIIGAVTTRVARKTAEQPTEGKAVAEL